MNTYPNGQVYHPEKAVFAIFFNGADLRIAAQSNVDKDKFFSVITSFFGRVNKPIKKISGRAVNPVEFAIPINRKLVVGEQNAIDEYNRLLELYLIEKNRFNKAVVAILSEPPVAEGTEGKQYDLRMAIADDFGEVERHIHGVKTFSLSVIAPYLNPEKLEKILADLDENYMISNDACESNDLFNFLVDAISSAYKDFKLPVVERGEHLEFILSHTGNNKPKAT